MQVNITEHIDALARSQKKRLSSLGGSSPVYSGGSSPIYSGGGLGKAPAEARFDSHRFETR